MMYDKIKKKLEKEAILYRDKKGNEYYMKNSDRLVVIVCVIIFILGIIIDANNIIFENNYEFPNISVLILFAILWACIADGIGEKKGIKSGFYWGFFLSIIGVIIVCILPNENNKSNENLNRSQSADTLKKYKELLDMGAITQEDFECMKLELLK